MILIHCQIYPALTSCTLGLCNSRTMTWNTSRSPHLDVWKRYWSEPLKVQTLTEMSWHDLKWVIIIKPILPPRLEQVIQFKGKLLFSLQTHDLNTFTFNKWNHYLKTRVFFFFFLNEPNLAILIHKITDVKFACGGGKKKSQNAKRVLANVWCYSTTWEQQWWFISCATQFPQFPSVICSI